MRLSLLFTALLVCLTASATLARQAQRAPAEPRPLNLNHPLRQQVGPEALLRAVAGLASGNQVGQLPRHVRKALSKLAVAPERSLRKPRVQARLLTALRTRLGDDRYELVLGHQAVGVKQALKLLDDHTTWGPPDPEDMQRGWGWQLLPKHDKAFYDPRFLGKLLRESDQTANGYVHYSPSQAEHAFEHAWSQIAPRNTRPVEYALAGSDANNLLYNIALKAAQRRTGDGGLQDAEIIAFDGVYGGGRGRITGLGLLPFGRLAPPRDDLKVVSPHSYYFKPTDPAEISRLEKLEAQALAQIEEKVRKTVPPVGGILMEPILGAKGVLFYRPEFMTKLRALCDKLQVPIFADEILSGGGRTGKFFAYQHYEGFEPDFVTFGKGLQVAGVASVQRSMGWGAPHGSTTVGQYAEPLLKGAQVLNRIREDRLMENATKVGARIVKHLQKRDRLMPGDTPDTSSTLTNGPSRGMGMLIYTRAYAPVMGAMGRLMPYLSLTLAEADRIFRN
jgi:acetylornithine/succinyldiaminopimelate/putrescine aminotransferase